MQTHFFKINELERKSDVNVYHHLRQFVTLYSDEEVEKFSGHIETIVRKPQASFSARFHVGNAGSETPFDGHLTIFGSGLYWGVSLGSKIAQKLTSSPEYKYDGRDLSVRIDDGKLWLRVWTPPDRWTKGEFAEWRDAVVALNPFEWFQGPKRYNYENLDKVNMVLHLPEDEETYPVTLTLQKCLFGRKKGKRRIISYVVDVNAPKGIPDHYDHSGGWKGDRVYGFSVGINNAGRDWFLDAKNLVIADILKNRGNSGFREAQPVD
jgi:hypothetical protein